MPPKEAPLSPGVERRRVERAQQRSQRRRVEIQGLFELDNASVNLVNVSFGNAQQRQLMPRGFCISKNFIFSHLLIFSSFF